jgi:hypothetical protein
VKHKPHGSVPRGSDLSLLPEVRIVKSTHSPVLDMSNVGVGPPTFPYDWCKGSWHHENVFEDSKVRAFVVPQSCSFAARK